MSGRLQVFTLGGLALKLDGQPVTGLVSHKAEAVVVYLARAARPVTREVLASLLWDDSPQSAALTNLRVVLTSLRRGLGDRLAAGRETLELEGGYWLDAAELDSGLAKVEGELGRGAALTREGAASLAATLELYRGDFLQGFFLRDASGFEEWASLERERLSQRMITGLDGLVEFYVRCGEYRLGLAWANRLLELDPLRESAHRQLMLLLARAGQLTGALAHYEACAQLLKKELGVEPEAETQNLYQHLKDAGSAYRHNLPTFLTPFIGREAELAQAGDWLTQSANRLVSVVGPGGLGKTRLAVQVAADKLGAFLHGVCFVSLADLGPESDEQAVISEIAEGLRLTFTGATALRTQLFNYLREKELLLVLDNFEQVVETAGLISELLVACPKVRVLTTARVRLNISGEWAMNLGGLAVPETAALDEVGGYSAVQLFVQTASRVTAHFELTPATAPAVVRACELVGGLPLAIELAAAWTRALPVTDIAERIEHDLDFLTAAQRDLPARQRSVRVVFDHSWSQLSEAEAATLIRLAVFHGSFPVEAARQVAGATGESLLRLVDHALVRQVSAGRFQLHPLLRQFASGKLAEQAEAAAAAQREHALYFARRLAALEADLKGPKQIEALQTIAQEIENVRAAWRWAAAQAPGSEAARQVVRLSLESLALFYLTRGWYQEGAAFFGRAAEWLKTEAAPDVELLRGRLLERQGTCGLFTDSPDLPERALRESLDILEQREAGGYTARAQHGLGYLAFVKGDYAEAERFFTQGLNGARQAGDGYQQGAALSVLAEVADRLGQVDRARQLDEENLALQRRTGEPRSLARALNAVGISAMRAEAYDQAEALFAEAIEISLQMNDRYLLAAIYTNRSFNAFSAGDLALAEDYSWESHRLCQECADYWGEALALNNLGEFAHARGDYAGAKKLYQQGIELYRRNEMKTGLPQILADLGLSCLALEELAAAREHLREALQLSHEMGTTPMTLKALGGWARLLALEGQPEAGLVLAALAATHPASEADARGYARQVSEDVQAKLPPERAAAAQTQAKSLDLDGLIEALLAGRAIIE